MKKNIFNNLLKYKKKNEICEKSNEPNKNRKINRKVLISCLLILLVLGTFFSIFSTSNLIINDVKKLLNGLGIYTEEINSVIMKSQDYGNAASWKITKSAEWTANDTVQVIFDVDSVMKNQNQLKDVILVLDISQSMEGDKLDRVKKDSKDFISNLLENSNNRVSIITFGNTSNILSSFSNDEENLLSKIDDISLIEGTNYYAALQNVDVVMNDYNKESNRDVVTLFLTDGYPNIGTPNQVGLFEVLKQKYPYMKINGVQYEMDIDLIKEIKQITDSQWIVDLKSLNNILFDAANVAEKYEKFVITDYVNSKYFDNVVKNDIVVNKGYVVIQEDNDVQKIVWDLDDSSFSTGEKAKLVLNLKLKDEYISNENFFPISKKTEVDYNILNKNEENDTIIETPVLKNSYVVSYNANPPSGCDLPKYDDEKYFVFQNVTKKDDVLTCDGYLFKGWEIEESSAEDIKKVNDSVFLMPKHDVVIRGTWTKHNIKKSMDGTVFSRSTIFKVLENDALNGKGAEEYIGEELDDGACNIYYYNKATSNNNVIFGNHCWKMIRSTNTCGVKLLYNGVPSSNGKCNNTGAATQIESPSEFDTNISLANVGYMYNKTYNPDKVENTGSIKAVSKESLNTNYYYGDSITISGSSYYSQTATLTNPNLISTLSDYSTLENKYVASKTSSNYSAFYVIKVIDDVLYGKSLTSSHWSITSSNDSYTYGDSFVDNGNGTVTVNNATTFSNNDWFDHKDNFNNKYYCSGTSSTCNYSNFYLSRYIENDGFSYVNITSSLYGKTVTYNSSTKEYTLVDTKKVTLAVDSTANDDISNHHYTCLGLYDKCSTVKYVYYVSGDTPYYIELSDGKVIEDVINEMLIADDVNTKDSKVKTNVETWFENNLLDYESYIEDTVYCNDRRISNLNGWNPNGGDVEKYLRFYSYDNFDLSCENLNDRFTKYVENGNGKLKYPVGLLTAGEAKLVGKAVLASGDCFWTSTPDYFAYSYSVNYAVYVDGLLNGYRTNGSYGVRPVISIIGSLDYFKGNGSLDKPYVIDVSSINS